MLGDVAFRTGQSKLFVYRSQYAGTNKATAVIWVAEEVEDLVRTLKARGVSFEHYDLPNMTRQGDLHVHETMKVAWFKDPDGHIFQPRHAFEDRDETNGWSLGAGDRLAKRLPKEGGPALKASQRGNRQRSLHGHPRAQRQGVAFGGPGYGVIWRDWAGASSVARM